MRFFARLNEGESAQGTLISYKSVGYYGLNNEKIDAFKIIINLKFFLLKIEFIPVK